MNYLFSSPPSSFSLSSTIKNPLNVFSCRRLTPFRPFNLTFAYPYGKG